MPLLRSRLGETGSDLMLMLGLVLTVKVAAEMEAVAAACGRWLPCLAEKGEGCEGQKPCQAGGWQGRHGHSQRRLLSHPLKTWLLAKMS